MKTHAVRGAALACVAAIALLSGCAGPASHRRLEPADVAAERERQREMIVQSQVEDRARLVRVAWPILVASTPLCEDIARNDAGVLLDNAYSFPVEMRRAARSTRGLGEWPRVLAVAPGSKAEAAGLVPGDEIMGVGGRPLPGGPRAVPGALEAMREGLEEGPVELVVDRGGRIVRLQLEPEPACAAELVVAPIHDVNAFADGERVIVTRGLMRFAADDNELAQVIAHEVAHNALDHMGETKIGAGVGLVLDIFFMGATGVDSGGVFQGVGAGMASVGNEAEADYVGLYLMARAGYPVLDAAGLWRRMAVEEPGSINGRFMASHPSTPERFLSIEQAAGEIELKRQLGLPILPGDIAAPDGD